MAALQERNGRFRVIFRHQGRQRSVNLGKVSRQEAEAKAGAIDLLLLRLKQRLIALPDGVTVEHFAMSEGRPQPPRPASKEPADGPVGFSKFCAEYLEARSAGSMEANSLSTAKMHLRHLNHRAR